MVVLTVPIASLQYATANDYNLEIHQYIGIIGDDESLYESVFNTPDQSAAHAECRLISLVLKIDH